MKPMVIGISGKIGSGKDTIADYLVQAYGFQVVRFSDALKEEVLKILPLTCVEIWHESYARGTGYQGFQGYPPGALGHQNFITGRFDPTQEALRKMLWEDKPPIIRRLLQEWGTDLRRNEQHDYWIQKWNEKVWDLVNKKISVVTPDARFWNEIHAINTSSDYGLVVRVDRPGTVEGDHLSEHEWTQFKDWDHVFTNDSTKEALYSQVVDFYKEHERLEAH